MDPAPSLLALLGRGPGIAVFPGAARRLAPPYHHKATIMRAAGWQVQACGAVDSLLVSFDHFLMPVNPQNQFCLFLRMGASRFGPKCGSDKVFVQDLPPNRSHGVFQALSTSFEKTCMRHFHSLGFHSPWSNQIKVPNMSRTP